MRGYERGNTPEHFLKREEFLIELAMGREKVNEHW